MNFFGHATVACWHRTHERFVLGAMLPDLERMSQSRRVRIDDVDVREGIAWHHRTDAAFHECPTFSGLCRLARRRLLADAVPRGPTLAIAHVGVELLLDGVLLGLPHPGGADPVVRRAYRRALTDASGIVFGSREEAVRFEAVLTRLAHTGLPMAYRDPSEVALRLRRILARSPRLAYDARHDAAVERWARAAQQEIVERAPTLLAELDERLAARDR